MRVAFLSNYFNHHQKPVSDALMSGTAQYTFISTQKLDVERKALGWTSDTDVPYVCTADGTAEYAVLRQSDVVIVGSAPEALVQWAARRSKLLFRYSERPHHRMVAFSLRSISAFTSGYRTVSGK